MLIRIGYDIGFDIPAPVAMVSMLHVHPSRAADLRGTDDLTLAPPLSVESYIDGFGNRCSRFVAPQGTLRLSNITEIEDSGEPDPTAPDAQEHPVGELPTDTLQYLLNSRYCEVDRLSNVAVELFGGQPPGWSRVRSICDWVHNKVMFGYQYARPTKTAVDVFTERTGVCRDFQHLAVTFCRALHIPARYATGYLAVAPFVWTVFSVFRWKNCSANRRRGGGNVKIGFIDFQGLVGRAENSSIVFRPFHETGISTA